MSLTESGLSLNISSIFRRVNAVDELLTILSEPAVSESAMLKSGGRRTHLFQIIRALEESSNVSYILDSQHRFVYCNPAWDSFAKSNDAPQLVGEAFIGSNVLATIPDVLKDFYAEAFQRVLSSESVWRFYATSSRR